MKPLVSNAADAAEVREAEKKQQLKISQTHRDLQAVLRTSEGRRVFWRLLERARVFESVWENSARIHYNAGRQDFGHEIMADIVEAGEKFFFDMMVENRKDS